MLCMNFHPHLELETCDDIHQHMAESDLCTQEVDYRENQDIHMHCPDKAQIPPNIQSYNQKRS